MPSSGFRLVKSFKALFYLFCAKSARLCRDDLSHWCSCICRRQVGQIPTGLFHRAQAVTHQKSFIDEESEIIRLQGHAPRRLPVEQRHQLYRSCSARAQVAHQELARHTRVHQPFHEQDVLTTNVRLVAEENLHDLVLGASLWSGVSRFDKLAHHRHFQRSHQIGLKHERILQDRQHLDGLALVVVGDLATEFLDSLLDLIGGDDWAKGLDSRTVHEICAPPGTSLLIFPSPAREPRARPKSESPLAPASLQVWLAPEMLSPTRFRRHSRPPAKTCAPPGPHDAPAAVP